MTFYVDLAYIFSAFLFVVGLKQLSSPATARKGNQMAAVAMLIAIVVTLVEANVLTWTWVVTGIIIGSLIGAVAARTVKMTSMPEMVGIFNGFGAELRLWWPVLSSFASSKPVSSPWVRVPQSCWGCSSVP